MNTEKRSTEPNSEYLGFYPVIAPLIMGKGVGDGKTTSCVMAQAATIDALRRGKTLTEPTDRMDCACPLLRNMAINANDSTWWASDKERTEELRPLIPLLLDSRVPVKVMKKRAARLSNAVIHELTPMRLEWIASNTKDAEYAKACRGGDQDHRENQADQGQGECAEGARNLFGFEILRLRLRRRLFRLRLRPKN